MVADVDQPPSAHPLALRVGAAQHPGLERRLLPRRQTFRSARAGPVVQPVHPFRVVAQHRVPQRLPLHPGRPRRLGPRQAPKRVGDGEQPHRGAAVRLAPRRAAELLSRQVLADGERGHDGGPPRTSRHSLVTRATQGSEFRCAGIYGCHPVAQKRGRSSYLAFRKRSVAEGSVPTRRGWARGFRNPLAKTGSMASGL
jgi:hypothetical protein